MGDCIKRSPNVGNAKLLKTDVARAIGTFLKHERHLRTEKKVDPVTYRRLTQMHPARWMPLQKWLINTPGDTTSLQQEHECNTTLVANLFNKYETPEKKKQFRKEQKK